VAATDALARAVDVKAADVELFDAKQHRNDRRQYTWDIRRREMLERRGWTIVRVVAGDQPADIIRRVKATLARRVSR
jgi:very-short-patch-repair endonuclease